MSNNMVTADSKRIDWMITLVPFILIMALAVYLFIFPEQANGVISQVRFFFGDTVGLYYLVIGVGVLLVSLFLSFSKYGDIVLGAYRSQQALRKRKSQCRWRVPPAKTASAR